MTIKNIILLGATGSIGKSTLKLIRKKKESLIHRHLAYEKTEELKLISEEFDVKMFVFLKMIMMLNSIKVKFLTVKKVFLN